MGIDTHAALKGDLTPEQIAERLRANCGGMRVQARRMRSPDHWVFEFEVGNGEHRALEAFLNGFAASDFPELGFAIQTLLSMELGPDSETLIRGAALGCEGWIRAGSSIDWAKLN
jgi:hypothetical protein